MQTIKIEDASWWLVGREHPGSLVTLLRLATPLIYLNHEVSALSTSNHVDAPNELNLRDKFIFNKKLSALWQYKRLLKNYDILYTFSYNRLQLPYLIYTQGNLPKLIIDLNVDTIDLVDNMLVKMIIRKILKASEYITTPSLYYKLYLVKNWKLPPEKIKHIYYSVGDSILRKETESFRNRILITLDLDPSLKTIVHTDQVSEFQMKVYSRLMKMFNLNLCMIGSDLKRQKS